MTIEQLAEKHGFSREAVQHLAEAMHRGNQTQAQFNHPEFGGMGQWQNGMLMIGDAFNTGLKARISALCEDLVHTLQASSGSSGFGRMQPMTMTTTRWWPDELGEAASAGQQNEAAYAIFPRKARLAIRQDGEVRVYDTGTYQLVGVSQQQDNAQQGLRFSTQRGKTVTVRDFTLI